MSLATGIVVGMSMKATKGFSMCLSKLPLSLNILLHMLIGLVFIVFICEAVCILKEVYKDFKNNESLEIILCRLFFSLLFLILGLILLFLMINS